MLHEVHRRKWPYAVLAVLPTLFIGCESIVFAPDSPADPVAVYLIKDARHRGLVLPRNGGGFVEFGYGDWDWYALQRDRWYHAIDTVLWPTQGTLARREVPAADERGLRSRFPWMEIQAIVVAREDLRILRERLDLEYRQRAAEAVYHPATGMFFVPHDDGFWFLYNCSDAVAAWLRQLGCSVTWVLVRADLSVASGP